MKKFIAITIACILSAVAFAGNSSHLSFNGVSMANSLAQFSASLKKAGMKDFGQADGVSRFVGKVNEHKGCDVGVVADENDNVKRVVVIFPDLTSWNKLAKEYFEIKENLTAMYGNPVNHAEEFKHSYAKKTKASDLLEGLMFDQCDYHSVFASGSDLVSVEICHNGVENCFVRLCYYNNTNL